jgi:NAD(P)-dependent dehydrogenase (short-subunit alcohol dehydrogenase family)
VNNELNSLGIRGRRTLVTGAASGIGRARASLLSQLGAVVAIADVNAETLSAAATKANAVAAYICDVSSEADVDRMFGGIARDIGQIEAVVNCAAVAAVDASTEQSIELSRRVVDVNLLASHIIACAAARQMQLHDGGRIVLMSSITGGRGFPRRAAYGASKAGVSYLARCLACEWGGAGITVNALVPGYIRTAMVDSLVRQNKVDATRIEARTPLGRMGTPEEVAKAAAFLISDWADFITGTEFFIDGGWSAFGGSGEVASF